MSDNNQSHFKRIIGEKQSPPESRASRAKPINMKYTASQIEKLKLMTPEQKEKVLCQKCSEYFHNKESCKNFGLLCFKCFLYGHEAKNCLSNNSGDNNKKGELYKRNISRFTENISLILDSAATHHIVGNKIVLLKYESHLAPIPIHILQKDENVTLTSEGTGMLPVLFMYKNSNTVLILCQVQYILNAPDNLLSMNQCNTQFRTSSTLNCKSGFILSRRLKKNNLARSTW